MYYIDNKEYQKKDFIKSVLKIIKAFEDVDQYETELILRDILKDLKNVKIVKYQGFTFSVK